MRPPQRNHTTAMHDLTRTLPLVALALAISLTGTTPAQELSPVPVPKENPVTPAKAVLGKMLFWDEQLSSDNTMACGTCHQPRFGGTTSRFRRHPGFDGKLRTPDDVIGARGIRWAKFATWKPPKSPCKHR